MAMPTSFKVFSMLLVEVVCFSFREKLNFLVMWNPIDESGERVNNEAKAQ